MAERPTIQAKLRELAPKAYREGPSTPHLAYPCFTYRLEGAKVARGDNLPYLIHPKYSVLYICEEANDGIIRQVLEAFPHCAFDRHYEADQLHHYSFTVFY